MLAASATDAPDAPHRFRRGRMLLAIDPGDKIGFGVSNEAAELMISGAVACEAEAFESSAGEPKESGGFSLCE